MPTATSHPCTAAAVSAALAAVASPSKAASAARFFKTGPGQYGEGDVFIGVTVPAQRKIARAFEMLPHKDLVTLLKSKIHEQRLTALLVLVRQFERGDEATQDACYALLMKHRRFVNNWDLVDSSAHQIVGALLLSRETSRDVLYELARSSALWDRRIAMISTYAFIRKGESKDAFAIAALLLQDPHDLMHKAVGWMLREVGKRVSADALRAFLKKHAAQMPRTALRYAIEHFPAAERKRWLAR